ncbi:neutral zinc metallopeptidase [Agromyces mariniharenae]|uniref:Neutral zinc metallopeptidase n=1 Tax=Agromyces mariniharenae TaxID=2604423 RepID=A0A5S4V528_9MICO|nr:neutral zinc metallopeptidase [Agromyces mariniharenae]TYL54136.1 neutral zinc metallopeptidase [Agromyces mariniharenae]
MTFNPNADIGGGKTSKRGRNTGIAVGGGLGVIALVIISQLLGVDVTGLLGGGGGQPAAEDSALQECQTGQDANERIDCRMKGAAASLEDYWVDAAPTIGVAYASPQGFVLFTDAVATGCGNASSATGPFYCPPDQTLYVDTTFYDQLESQFGASGGPLAEMYVVAHEWGHHIQNLAGILERAQDGQTGPTSNSVRTELQADCFAGSWAAAASQTTDERGVPFLQPITRDEYAQAIDAAAAVGDDRIQEATQGQVSPHSFTHGSSEQRVRWFETGYQGGAQSCDTFSIDGSQL